MTKRPWGSALLLLVALLLSLWLQMGRLRILGELLMIPVFCGSLFLVGWLPRETLERKALPAEWKAWINSAFLLIIACHFLANFDAFVASLPWESRIHPAAVDSQGILIFAWVMLSAVMAVHWKTSVQEDERDREIAAKGVRWGRGTLIVCVIGVVAALLLTPLQNLQWATPQVIANLLLFALMSSWLAGFLAIGFTYRRDRL